MDLSLVIVVESKSTDNFLLNNYNTLHIFTFIHIKFICTHKQIKCACYEITAKLHRGYNEDTLHSLTVTSSDSIALSSMGVISTYLSHCLFGRSTMVSNWNPHTDINCSQIPFSGYINTQSCILSACVQTHLWQY